MAEPSVPSSSKQGQVQGEGDYESAKRFQKAEHEFARSGKVQPAAKAAEEALEGPEGAELEQARQESARGRPGHKG